MKKCNVIFYPENKKISVDAGSTILNAAIAAEVYINSACGGDGVCGRCKVKVLKGQVSTQPTGSISVTEIKNNIYLACLTTLHSDSEIEILPQSKLDLEITNSGDVDLSLRNFYNESSEVISLDIDQTETIAKFPLIKKVYIELPLPDINDKISDLERLYRAISLKENPTSFQTGLINIRLLGELLRSSDWKVTVTLLRKNNTQSEITAIEPGNTSGNNYGFCFDIGTTTISGQLIDLNSMLPLASKAHYNKQVTLGSDVISRIIYAQQPDGLEKLHFALSEGINQIIHELTQECKVSLNDVTCIVCAGNTTMIHLLLRIDPTHIRKEPYIPTANFIPVIRAHETGIKINPHGILYCIPGVASYLGGDIVSGVFSCGIHKKEENSILIDIGTNGEVVLGNNEFLIGCAASAGPAFEGSGVSCGMRATKGAIQNVTIDPVTLDVKFSTIGQAKPLGICGSGYIDLIAEMLSTGIIDKIGKINSLNSKRIRKNEFGMEYILVFKEGSANKEDIVISEIDIDNIKRAKAAIYSSVATLLKHMSLQLNDIAKFYIAGGFGTYLDIPNAIKIGLLPDLPREKFIFVGNSSLSGARQLIVSSQNRESLEEIARKTSYLELSVESNYMDEYMAALFFPHTDLTKFPSLNK
jgi:uncharacterized 2Fe-2S/4Fe-4S cluster protein (DUF4445 family)